ncbi:tyrosine-type recombinase/integrase [Natronobacterium gregoryi]|uniref:Integrase n=2 Tax=Natronobacterium gregoryi TaxID=44930 RepID=L0AL33_NATGS|nr:tyrosine-type recombinase/integrase [Natronobacterium gregoryi]AFZ73760.1 site-specific recombinase XerD [Natronobacterium gregoryi SP2]ELY65818.1 integrase family protein [Natronobacterium gregoryi SP2]PLK19448.1 integrase [Natronobacterium gregoryi SP2]SFJ48703.1 Site-specific recombinase XerD [Natronobacterium gregoryi]
MSQEANSRFEWPEKFASANTLAVPRKSQEQLNLREQQRYADFRRNLFKWMVTEGKNPRAGDGYSLSSLSEHSSRLDQFLRWLWNHEGRFTVRVTQDHADDYLETVLRESDYSKNHKRKTVNTLQILFKYKAREQYGDHDWDPVTKFREPSTPRNFTDYLRPPELDKIKSAALSYGSVPPRNQLSEDELDFWQAEIAQRFGKPKAELDEEDWMRANSYKIPSLVSISCDVGFRPCEVNRSRLGWFRKETKEMVIPKNESSKNEGNWECYLSDESVELLERWEEERELYDEYENTNAVWLTREGNPYTAQSLRDLMRRLFEEAGMSTEERELGWYLIRRGAGTIIGKQGVLPVMEQLRIKRVSTAKRYVKTSEETLREAVNSY